MKPIKMFGLAALAALMAMAFLGASSATAATYLCGADEGESCAAPLTHVHETSVGKAILLASPKIECNVLFLGEVSEGEAGQAVVEGNFTYSNCGAGCSVTEQSASSTVEVKKTGHETASVAGEGEFHVNCIGINCYFNGEGLIGTAKGPLLSTQANGEVSIQEQMVHQTKGTFCPSTAKLDITTTPLSATYLAGMECIEKTNGQFFHAFNNGECDPNRYEKILEHGVWKCVVQANGLYALKNTNELDCENDVNNSKRYELIS